MNEWPENLTGLDWNWNLIDTASKVVRTAMFGIVLVAGLGVAQATELPTIFVAETAEWMNLSGWFADGAAGGFDAAGASVGGW